jgi:hypothetical protein
VSVVVEAVAAPWPHRDRIVLGALETVGFGMLGLSWLGVSGTTTFSRQVAWTNVGGVGLVVVLLGCALWVQRGRRRIGQHLRFESPIRMSGRAAGAAEAGETASNGFVSAAGMSRYHRPDCQAVAGKSVITAGADAHRAEGRRPCGLCLWGTPPDPRGTP